MAKLFPCLWFDGNAEEAASFYVTLLPNSHVDKVWPSPAETPSGPAGMVLTVDFTVAGEQVQGLNGGPDFNFNEAGAKPADIPQPMPVLRAVRQAVDGRTSGPILRTRTGRRMDRAGASRALTRVARAAGSPARSAPMGCAELSALPGWSPGSASPTCSTPCATPTRAPPCVTTWPRRTSTGTSPTPSPPTLPA